MIDSNGIYRDDTRKKLLSKTTGRIPTKGLIANWPTAKRSAFERELLASNRSIAKIAETYGVATNTAADWKKRVLMPAVRAAEQQANIDKQGEARQYLHWLYDEARDSIEKVKRGTPVLDTEGQPVMDEKTGQPKRDYGDPKVHGTVAQLIGQGRSVAELIGNVSGEFPQGGFVPGDRTPIVIKCITIPKTNEMGTYGAHMLPAPEDAGDEIETQAEAS